MSARVAVESAIYTEPGRVSGLQTGDKAADFRLPSFSPEEVAIAEAKLAMRGRQQWAPLVSSIREQAQGMWVSVLGELNAAAGGQASVRPGLLAHYALRAHVACELQHLLGLVAVAEESDSADKSLRNLAGLAVVATDLLNKAYAAAEAEGKAKQAKLEPVDALMATLGVPGPAGDGSSSVPDLMGGVGAVGAPLSPNPAPPLAVGPLSQPKPTPASPALNLDPASPSVFAAPLPKKPPRRKGDST